MDGHRETNVSREMMDGKSSQRNGVPPLTLRAPSAHWRNSPDIAEVREIMLHRTAQFLAQTRNMSPQMRQKLPKIDELLYQMAQSKEDYMNMETIERRLQICLQRFRRFSQEKKASGPVNPPSSIGTMIPTPGLYQTTSRNALTLSQEDNHVNALNAVPSPSSSFASTVSQAVHDRLSNVSGLVTNDDHHSPANVSLESCGSNMMSFANGQGTQMIPTPGLSNSQSMLANANFFTGNQYLMHGDLESLNISPYSVRSNTKQNSGSIAVLEKINPGNNSLLPIRPLSMRQPSPTESHVCNVTRKRKIESACLHDEYGTEMHVSWHKQVQLPHSHLTGGHDSRVVNNQQLMVKSDLINKAQPGFQSGNQNFFDCRMEHVGSYAQSFEQSQFTRSQVDFMGQRCLGNDYFKDDEMADNSVGSCDAHPSMPLEPLLQEHRETATPFSKHFQDDFSQRMTNLDEAQQLLSSVEDNSIIHKGRTVAKDSVTRAFANVEHKGHRKQQRWLLLLLHAKLCSAPKGQCVISYCSKAQEDWQHLCQCTNDICPYTNCRSFKRLVIHYQRCRDPSCHVCNPVRCYIARRHEARISDENLASLKNSLDSNRGPLSCAIIPRMSQIKTAQIMGNPEEQKVLVERKMMNHCSTNIVVKSDGLLESPSYIRQYDPEEVTSNLHEQKALEMNAGGKESVPAKTGNYLLSRLPSNSILSEIEVKEMENINDQKPAINSSMKDEHFVIDKSETVVNEDENQHNGNKVKLEQEPAIEPSGPVTLTKTEKLKIMGVSLIELFTPEQVKEHVNSLMQWFGQSKAKAEKNQASGCVFNENACQLCGVEKLVFQPPPIHCTKCGARIKRNVMYYTRGFEDTRHFICIRCFNEAACDSVKIAGDSIPKSELKKTPNNKKAEEGWVKCDDCDLWQHQICALFNNRKNGLQVEYTCPHCYIAAIERGEQKPLPKNAVMGAEDLPTTMLSDHIEQRLAKKLKQERHDRAKLAGKNFDEVAGAEGLVVRVVSSVDKRLEVKQQFLEYFRVKNYPAEFAYKSKVILLFQKIEGVEVLLFGMYVQEFGSECPSPNQRRVYLSYLDSVKYFRPEIKAVSGEALRTVVYHEILIGYLEHCKARGFTSCYIWACPPLKGEDYIFYCHPEIQKTPKSDKLREWYLSMLRKATSENIVVGVTNFYDHFFTSAGECKAEVTATRLPYFEGDYWPGAAEDMIIQLHQEEGGKQLNEVKLRRCLNRRSSKAADAFNPSCNASKDTMLMQKLGESILPLKEDFIMVHLQKACSYCAHLMVFGKRWICKNCESFQLCDKCYDNEQSLDERERHPMNNREKHFLWPQEIKDVAADTKDSDEILDSEFLDTRQAFLSLCQGNYYQYDTLRRAKHSSMMVLYHLHNPAAPAFVSLCNICRLDIKTGQGWRCEICPDFDVCSMCYQKDEKFEHPHTLKNHSSLAEHDAQNREARQQRLWRLQKMLDLLGHASQCRVTQCKYSNCVKMKSLFRHGIRCTIRASGGCGLCVSMWRLLKMHARACKTPECRVPRCKDLKEHMKRLLQQEDFRRREEVMEMMRQRAAEMKKG